MSCARAAVRHTAVVRRAANVLVLGLFGMCAIATAARPAFAAAGQPCATMAVYELVRRGTPALDVGFGERPAAADIRATFDSAVAGHALRVHAGNGVDDARALQVLGFFDDAWTQQIDGAGFPPPLDDGSEGGDARFDVYVVPLVSGLAGVTFATEDVDPDDGKHASPSFIQIDPSLADDLLEVFAHHEFQHALQFAIDTEEPVMWFEATAVFWEVRTEPLVDDWLNSLPDFQRAPFLPIFGDGALAASVNLTAPRYEYGAALFALYLDEVHGDAGVGTLLTEVWLGTPQPDDVDENEPDFIDALAAAGVDPGAAVAEFANWRTLVGALSVDTDGPAEAIPESAALTVVSLNAATLDGDQEITDESDGPYPLGCAVRRVTAPANIVDSMPVEVRVEATLPDQLVRVALLVTEADLPAPLVRRETDAAASHFEQVDVPANHLLQVAVCDVTPAASDPDVAPAVRPVSISMLRTDVDFPDAGPPPEEDAGVADVDAGPEVPPQPMCSCQSSPPAQQTSQTQRTKLVFSLFAMGATILALTVKGVRQKRRGTRMKRKER